MDIDDRTHKGLMKAVSDTGRQTIPFSHFISRALLEAKQQWKKIPRAAEKIFPGQQKKSSQCTGKSKTINLE